MSETKSFPFIAAAGPVYSKLFDLLTTTTASIITDTELHERCGEDCSVGGKGYGTLCRVIKRAEKVGHVWERIAKGGAIRRLGASEKLTSADGRRQKAVRGVRRAATIASSIDLAKLPSEERPRANALMAQLGALSLMGSTTTSKKIEANSGESVADVGAVMSLIIGTKKLT